jgi:hypothetical protein
MSALSNLTDNSMRYLQLTKQRELAPAVAHKRGQRTKKAAQRSSSLDIYRYIPRTPGNDLSDSPITKALDT